MPHRIAGLLLSTEWGNTLLTAFAIPSMWFLGVVLEIESKTWGYLCIAGAVVGKYIVDEVRYRRGLTAEKMKDDKRKEDAVKADKAAAITAQKELDLREQARKDRESEQKKQLMDAEQARLDRQLEREQDRLDKIELARLTVQTAESLKQDVRAAGAEREQRIINKVDENTEETKAARQEAKAALDAANGIKATVADKLDTVLKVIIPSPNHVQEVHFANDENNPVITKTIE